jgi:predicted O-methyltransferase YrrM
MERPTLDRFPKKVLAKLDIERAFIASRVVVAAERLQIFRMLHRKSMGAAALEKRLRIHPRSLAPFLSALVSLGLLRRERGAYRNTPFANRYFVAERSIHWTRRFSAECVEDYEALTVLEQVLASGKSPNEIRGVSPPSYVEAMKEDPSRAEDFTQMLFHLHQGEAEALASYLDLSGHHSVLDVGGGSGVMSIALAKRHRHLRACILDVAPVCATAARNIRSAGLSSRVTARAGDIREPLPGGFDVILCCDIGAVPDALLRHAFASLPPRGLLVLADRFLQDDGLDPLDRILEHFVGSSFGLATRRDMVQAVRSSGFHKVIARNVYRDVWFVTGRRPAQRVARA